MVTPVILRLFLVAFLVALNAFFVAAEYALVSLRETRIQELVAAGRHGARTVAVLHRNLDEVLNACQFGITIASLGLGWAGEPAVAYLFGKVFGQVPYIEVYSHVVALVIGFTIITYLHVILGEVVPKSLALQKAERVALAVAAPMEVMMTLMRPFLVVMNTSSAMILRWFGSRRVQEGGVHSPEELKLVVTASENVGTLPPLQADILRRAIELEEVTVRQVMVPRPKIFSLPASMPLDHAMQRIVEEQHSRVPVYDDERGPEHIIGILYAKDLAQFLHLRSTTLKDSPFGPGKNIQLRVRHMMREVMFVPETKPLGQLIEDFKRKRRHMAVVVDEFGSTSGIVTVEDCLEQLVGEIEDEYDIEPTPVLIGGGPMVIDGGENLRDLEQRYKLTFPEDEGYETLGGFVLARLQKVPNAGESFEYDGRRFTVLEMNGLRVGRVNVESTAKKTPVLNAGPQVENADQPDIQGSRG